MRLIWPSGAMFMSSVAAGRGSAIASAGGRVRAGTSALAGFAPRKQHLVIYLVGEFEDKNAKLMADLGPHKTGKGCLYVKRLADVDLEVLRDLIDRSVRVRRGVDRAAHRER
jgi:hypothetical protein